jgi:pyruvate kinase
VESRANRAISIIAKIESKDVLPNIAEIVEVRKD